MTTTAIRTVEDMRTTTATCTACGTAAPTVPPPYTWSMTVDDTSRSWTCVPCSRDHLPSIEGRGHAAR
jgi:hypothetical protein